MVEIKRVILLFLMVYVKEALLQDINISNDWTYVNDKSHQKVKPIFAPSNDHLKLTYAICNYVNETRTAVKCKITVEIETFSKSKETLKEECVLHLHSGDDYLIDKDTIKLQVFDSFGHVLIHREDVSLSDVHTSDKTVTFSRALKVRLVKMLDCSSTKSDMVWKLDSPRSKYYVIPDMHSFDIIIKKESADGNYYRTAAYTMDGNHFPRVPVVNIPESERAGQLVKLINSPRSDKYFGVLYRQSDRSLRVAYIAGSSIRLKEKMLIQNYDNHVIKYDFDLYEDAKYLLICASNSTKINCLYVDEDFNTIDSRVIDESGHLNQVIVKGPGKYVLWTGTNEFDKLTVVDSAHNRIKTKKFAHEKDDGARRFFGSPYIQRSSDSEERTQLIEGFSVTVIKFDHKTWNGTDFFTICASGPLKIDRLHMDQEFNVLLDDTTLLESGYLKQVAVQQWTTKVLLVARNGKYRSANCSRYRTVHHIHQSRDYVGRYFATEKGVCRVLYRQNDSCNGEKDVCIAGETTRK
ncbi:hypothetical protein TSAR_011424 [Trichomalopsis sarcophagae]|uniref:Uncharacterized protein n=1 Tax=Trichomalopsis sarcophagae TaxID=543379 RepID=A0A232F512_9HYME|nr:hypothetical protein TSAR_011424 [Trichomalopsis sarcophagae]